VHLCDINLSWPCQQLQFGVHSLLSTVPDFYTKHFWQTIFNHFYDVLNPRAGANLASTYKTELLSRTRK
jgi:hypothetical protein